MKSNFSVISVPREFQHWDHGDPQWPLCS